MAKQSDYMPIYLVQLPRKYASSDVDVIHKCLSSLSSDFHAAAAEAHHLKEISINAVLNAENPKHVEQIKECVLSYPLEKKKTFLQRIINYFTNAKAN